jgi:hypothetical protein
MDVCVCFYIVENMSNEYCVTYYCHLREMLRSNQSASCATLAACAAKPASAVEISCITFSPAEKHDQFLLLTLAETIKCPRILTLFSKLFQNLAP